jgi:hypothetical protein
MAPRIRISYFFHSGSRSTNIIDSRGMIGDLTFFTSVWPHDAARRLVWDSGTDNWFWIHVAQAIVLTMLAVWAFSGWRA